jgi:hypothetical protein
MPRMRVRIGCFIELILRPVSLCAGGANTGLATRLFWDTLEQFGVKLELAAPAWRLLHTSGALGLHGALIGLPAQRTNVRLNRLDTGHDGASVIVIIGTRPV